MAHSIFTVKAFKVLDRYEIRFGRDNQGFFYEMEDLETLATVGAEDGLTAEGLLKAVECALEPSEVSKFQQLVSSLV